MELEKVEMYFFCRKTLAKKMMKKLENLKNQQLLFHVIRKCGKTIDIPDRRVKMF